MPEVLPERNAERSRVDGRIAAMQFESVLLRQLRNKALVLIRLFAAQLVIDMHDRQHNP